MTKRLVDLIIARLTHEKDRISADFRSEKGVKTRFAAVDNLLPDEIARQFSVAFPPIKDMRFLDSFRERKYTSKSLDRFNELIYDITFAFQDKRVIDIVAEITD